MKAKPHTGFVADSGVQSHSSGKYFPITNYQVGGWPDVENNSFYHVVCSPCGVKRATFCALNTVQESFALAQRIVNESEIDSISEAVQFELALYSLELKGRHVGLPLGDF
jgi:hypothetical protein